MQNFCIGFSGLNVAQRAIDLIATNIANVGTEGYHRQELITRPVNLNPLGKVPIGGVEVAQIRRRIDTFLEGEINRQQTNLSQVKQELDLLQTVEGAFGQVGSEGISVAIGRFFDSLMELTVDPASLPLRGQVAWAADALTGQFRSLAQFLQNLSDQIDLVVDENVIQVNALGEDIAEYSNQIAAVTIQGGQANLLRDRQQQAIHELAELVSISVTEDTSRPEALYVSAWGKPLAVGTTAMELVAGLDSDGKLGIAREGSSVYDITISGGSIAGLLALKNDLIPDIVDKLDALAGQIITQINGLHVQGVGLTGSFSELTGASIGTGVINTWSTDITSGDFYLRLTDNTGADPVLTRTAISVDVTTDTASDVAGRIDAIDGLSASFANTILTIVADTNYEFDFVPAVLPDPYTETITGAADPTISGIYTGATNQVFTCTVVGSGEVGVDDDLLMEVRDAGANLIKRVDIGVGYAAADPIDIGSGLTVAWSMGQLNDSDVFTIQALNDSDPTGFLAAAGINTLFSGDEAVNIAVRQEIIDSPGRLATAAGAAGTDSANIRRMALVGQADLVALEDMEPGKYFNLLVTQVGQAVAIRQARTEGLDSVLQQLNMQRDEVTGVDLNEEAAKLIVFERMFQAMAKVITSQDRALQSLMDLV